MPAQWQALADPAAKTAWREVLRPVSDELRRQATELSAAMVLRLREESPGVTPDSETLVENQISIDQTLRSLADGLHGGLDPRGMELPAATVAFAEAAARRQLSAAYLTRSYRVGHEAIWSWFAAQIAGSCSDPALGSAATRLMTEWTFGYADAAITHVEQIVERERERWLRSALASRGAAIDAILSGEETQQDRAGSRLRYPLGRYHLGLSGAVKPGSVGGEAQELLTDAILTVARVLGIEDPLIYPTGVSTCVGWISRDRPFTPKQLERLQQASVGQVRLALGEPGYGLEGFRQSHLEAGHARSVASQAGMRGVVRYADVAVAALASGDRAQADAFVRRVLGPLAVEEEATRRAAEALAVYLDENRSRSRAGERLHVHPNTVTYRVRQAEQIMGLSVDRMHLDVRVALALLPLVRSVAKD